MVCTSSQAEGSLPFGQVLCNMNAGDSAKPSLVQGVWQVVCAAPLEHVGGRMVCRAGHAMP